MRIRSYVSRWHNTIGRESHRIEFHLLTDRATSTSTKKDADDEAKTYQNPLGGMPRPDPEDIQSHMKNRKRLSYQQWKQVFRNTWADYTYTWSGFFDNYRDKEENEQVDNNDTEYNQKMNDKVDEIFDNLEQAQKDASGNLKKNINSLKEDVPEIISFAQEKTGIYNKTDMKKWTMEQLKLANECVSSFMKGYRTGRDDEINKVMNEYFKDLEAEIAGKDRSDSISRNNESKVEK